MGDKVSVWRGKRHFRRPGNRWEYSTVLAVERDISDTFAVLLPVDVTFVYTSQKTYISPFLGNRYTNDHNRGIASLKFAICVS
jgi:hypothetical protein